MSNTQLVTTTEVGNLTSVYLFQVTNGITYPKFVYQDSGKLTCAPTYTDTEDVLSDCSLATSDPLACLAWEGAVYFSNLDLQLRKMDNKVVSVVNTTDAEGAKNIEVGEDGYRSVCAKYLCNSDSHLLLANLVVNDEKQPLMVTWSDLYDPDNFEESFSSEGGYYLFPSSEREIMGCVFNKGYTYFLTRSGCTVARYVGYSNGTFEFNSISNSVGCNFHRSVIAAKDAVFYIGLDNFYCVDGNVPSPIGTDIWRFFVATILDTTSEVPAFLDEDNDVVYWKFTANGENNTVSGALYDIIYNYKEQKWSLRSAEGIVWQWVSKVTITTPMTAEEVTAAASSFTTETCFDFIRPFSYKKLWFTSGNILQEDTSKKDGIDDAGRSFFLETKDFAFAAVDTTVNLIDVRLLCSHNKMLGEDATENGAYLKLSVGYRNNLTEDITWTDYVTVASWFHDEREIIFRFRKYCIAGKFFRLRISGLQAADSYMNNLSAVQFTVDIPKTTMESVVV